MGELTVEIADHVATVTLDRPPVNAITRSTMVEMRETAISELGLQAAAAVHNA